MMNFGVNNDFKGSVAIPLGSNLAGPGSYRDQIAAVIPNFPGLKFRQGLQADHSRYHASGRAAVYNFAANGKQTSNHEPQIVTDPARLREILTSPAKSSSETAARNLIILEGLQPDLVAVIGELWQIPPMLIKRHEFVGLWTMVHHAANYIAIPSALDPSRTFSFNYWYASPKNVTV